jgi:uncharacterized SAM-binding protein YcdF (DUF218 family)
MADDARFERDSQSEGRPLHAGDRGHVMTPRSSARDRARPGFPGCRILGAVAVVLVAVAALTPAAGWLATRYAEPARIEPADAIVVLGGAFGPDGWLDTTSLHRLVQGMRLYRQGLAPLLVLSGGTAPAGPSEPEIRARLARELGIPPAVILTVIGANTTYEESVKVDAALRPRGLRTILLVSGPLHLVRARGVFERAGFAVQAAPAQEIPLRAWTFGGRLTLARLLAQEAMGWLYYRLQGYV